MLLVALAFALYTPSWSAPFVLDDGPNIQANPLIQGDHLPGYNAVDTVAGLPPNVQSWRLRYVGYLTFYFNHRVHGLDVAGFHVVNTMIHALNAALVYALLLLLWRTPRLRGSAVLAWAPNVALATAVLFVVHPVQTMAVTYIVQRFASLAACFYLLALVLHLAARLEPVERRGRRMALALAALAAALLGIKTKETVVTLPAMVACIEFLFFDGPLARRCARALPYLAVAAVVPVTLALHPWWAGQVGTVYSELSRADYLLTEVRVVATYLRLLFLPVGLRIDYDYPPSHSALEPAVLLCGLVHAAVLAAAWKSWRAARTGDPAWNLVALGVVWFYVTLSVESSVVPIFDVIFEHRVYMPSVGALAALSVAAALVMRRHGLPVRSLDALLAMAILAAPLAALTVQRNLLWRDKVALLEDNVVKAPEKARSHAMLGYALVDANDCPAALRELGIALDIDPGDALSRAYLGRCHARQQHWELARDVFRAALARNPSLDDVHADLAAALWMTGEPEEALLNYGIARQRAPRSVRVRANLGRLLLSLGRVDEAIIELEEAVRLAPSVAVLQQELASARAAGRPVTSSPEEPGIP